MKLVLLTQMVLDLVADYDAVHVVSTALVPRHEDELGSELPLCSEDFHHSCFWQLDMSQVNVEGPDLYRLETEEPMA